MAQSGVWQGKGRIAISSDGNEHDHDDWSATAISIALLGASGLQDALCLYTYSDHIWGSNQTLPTNEIGASSYEQMRESALRGAELFGFDKSRFVCAVDNAEIAYERLKEQINLSTADNPLIIVAGGPMQVVGEAINRADRGKLKYVSLITHSKWNNNHGANVAGSKWDKHGELGWTYGQIAETQSRFGLNCVYITDQNRGIKSGGLLCDREEFDWLKNSKMRNKPPYKKGSWDWLYSRLETFPDFKSNKKGKFDVSDAGMVLYVLTGEEDNNPDSIRKIMENPIVR